MYATVCKWYYIFAKSETQNILAIKSILRLFKLAFGLKVKSFLKA